MKNKKYKLTNDITIIDGKALYRIKALRDTKIICKGTIGGYVESENNLSQDGECWISGDAKVYENAIVSENAYVKEKACIKGNAAIMGYARVSGRACISGDINIGDRVIVDGNIDIAGSYHISGNIRICEDVIIRDGIYVNYSHDIECCDDLICILNIGIPSFKIPNFGVARTILMADNDDDIQEFNKCKIFVRYVYGNEVHIRTLENFESEICKKSEATPYGKRCMLAINLAKIKIKMKYDIWKDDKNFYKREQRYMNEHYNYDGICEDNLCYQENNKSYENYLYLGLWDD